MWSDPGVISAANQQIVFIRHRRLLPTSAVCCQQTAMPNEDVAHACRGRDGSGCGLFGANRQVAGELHAQEDGQDVLQEALFQCLACKRPASRSPCPQRRPPVQRVENSFGGDANAVSHRRQRRFSPSGRPRPGTGRRKLDRLSARVR